MPWWLIKLAGSTVARYVLVLFLVGGGIGAAYAWHTSRFAPRTELEAEQDKVKDEQEKSEALRAALMDEKERRQSSDELYRVQLKKNAELNRHMDAIRDRLREIDDEDTQRWLATPVPPAIIDELRRAAAGIGAD